MKAKITVPLVSALFVGLSSVPASALPGQTGPVASQSAGCPGPQVSVSNTGGEGGNTTHLKVSSPGCNDSGGTGAARVCTRQAADLVGIFSAEEGKVDCTNNGRSWSNNHQCYATVTDLVIPAAFGRSDGVVLMCVNSHGVPDFWWAPSSPGEVTALSVAYEAAAQLGIRVPEIRTTRQETMQIVNFPMWLWVGNPGPGTTEQTSATASLEGVSVTATGTLDKIVYDMGDGHQEVCAGSAAAGTEYQTWRGREESPTCGYVYPDHADTPGSWFTMTATAHWTVTWSGAGQSGTFPVQVSESFPVQVGEVQTVVVPNPDR